MRSFALALNCILLLSILAACSSGAPTGKNTSGNSPNTIVLKIAADLPMSGAEKDQGRAIEDGVRLALDEANSSKFLPGYTFVFDPLDDVGANGSANPAIGAQNVTTFMNDAEVAGGIGPFNGDLALNELPLTNSAPLVQIGPTSMSECLTQDTPDTFCTGPNDLLGKVRPTKKITYFQVATSNSDQATLGADYAYRTLGYHSAFVIDDQTFDGTALASAFVSEYQADGGNVLGQDSFSPTTSYIHELVKIAELRPSIIYFASSTPAAALTLRKQMVEMQSLSRTALMGGDSLNTSAFATSPGAMNGGPVYSTTGIADVDRNAASASFVKAYKGSYGPLNTYSASSYDSAKILLNAIKAAIKGGAKVPANPSDIDTARMFRQAIINQVAQTKYAGVTGQQSFDTNGDTTNRTVTIYHLATVDGSPGWKYVMEGNLPSGI
jgi:branched-chain amino acid transport system substrate-binding protein